MKKSIKKGLLLSIIGLCSVINVSCEKEENTSIYSQNSEITSLDSSLTSDEEVSSSNSDTTSTSSEDSSSQDSQTSSSIDLTNKVKITFKNDDDSELTFVYIDKGGKVTYQGDTPTKNVPSTEENRVQEYTFEGWSLSIDGKIVDLSTLTFNENTTLYARFKEVLKKFTITFQDDKGNTLDTQIVEYGSSVTYKGKVPSKEDSASNGAYSQYFFTGWNNSEKLNEVKEDVTLTPIFTERKLFAYEIKGEGNNQYISIKEGEDARTINNLDNFELRIPSTIEEKPVREIPSKAFVSYTKAKVISVPNSVQTIGDGAFKLESNLNSFTKFYLPFVGASRDANVSVDSYGDSDSKYLKNKMKYIFESHSIGHPYSLTITDADKVGTYAFHNDDYVREIECNEGMTHISYYAFYNCTYLKNLYLPNSLTYLGAGFAANNWYSLQYTTDENYNYLGSKSNPYMVLYEPLDDNIEDVVVRKDVRFIADGAFYNCTKIKSVDLGKVQYIESGAFNCAFEKLEHLEIPDSVIRLGKNAFMGFTDSGPDAEHTNSLKSVKIGKGVKTIEEYCFQYAKALEWIYIPAGVEMIDRGMFSDCTNPVIYCDEVKTPTAWSQYWNGNKFKVYWKNQWEWKDNVPTPKGD